MVRLGSLMGTDSSKSRETFASRDKLTSMQATREPGDRSPFSSFRRRWMSGDQAPRADFSRQEERMALTASFLRRDSRDFANRTAGASKAVTSNNDFFRRHNTNRSRFTDISQSKESIAGDRSRNVGASGLSRFRATERSVYSASTGRETSRISRETSKETSRETSILRKTEISQSAIRKDGSNSVRATEAKEVSMLRQKAEFTSENARSRIKNTRDRGFARSMFETTKISKTEEAKESSKTDSPFLARRSYKKSVETSSITTCGAETSARQGNLERDHVLKSDATKESSKTDSPVIRRKSYEKTTEASSLTSCAAETSARPVAPQSDKVVDSLNDESDLSQAKKVPPKVVRKPVPKSPTIRCEKEEMKIPESPKPQRKQMFGGGNVEEMQLNMDKAINMSESTDSLPDSPQKLNVASLRNSLFGSDSTAFAAIAARGMGGTLAASPVTMRTRRATERRQVVSTTEIMQNGSISRSVYRMERKSESEVEISRNEAEMLPSLFQRFGKPKRKNITLPTREFRRSQLQITDGNEDQTEDTLCTNK